MVSSAPRVRLITESDFVEPSFTAKTLADDSADNVALTIKSATRAAINPIQKGSITFFHFSVRPGRHSDHHFPGRNIMRDHGSRACAGILPNIEGSHQHGV